MKKNKIVFFVILIVVIVVVFLGYGKLSSLRGTSDSQAKMTKPVQISTPPPARKPVQKSVQKPKPAVKAPIAKPVEPAPKTQDFLVRVGSWTLTPADFKIRLDALKAAVPEFDLTDITQTQQILAELIRQQLLVQDAEQRGVAKREDIVMAVEEFRRTLLVREVAAELTNDIEVTEADALEYYETNKADFVEPAQWLVREIVVAEEQVAKDILVELYKGADFEEMVKQSISKSAWQKGDLGMRSDFDFPKMEAIVSTLGIGDISGVFEGPEGFYIVKLEEKEGGEPKGFEEIKEDIVSGLTILGQQEAILEHLAELEENTEIEVNANLLEEFDYESGE